MEFEWDGSKAVSNLAKHQMVFEYGVKVFADPNHVEIDATRKSDREARRKCIGQVEGRVLVVVFTMRRNIYRIISARRANKKEERTYHGIRSHDA